MVVIAALAAVSSNQLAKYRVSLIGLFAVTTLLWINMSNAFLSAQLAGNNQMSQVCYAFASLLLHSGIHNIFSVRSAATVALASTIHWNRCEDLNFLVVT